MYTVFRWMVRLTSFVIILLVLGAIGLWYFASRSLPDYNATYKVSGISAPVEIVRSTEDVPHIFGATDPDVFFGLGLAHAQDRLWQMVILRRTVQGRLSEIFGASTVKTDELMRRLGLYDAAIASVDAQDAQTKAALDAYSAGVNEWIAQVNKGAMGRGAPEFFLFENSISYWTPADSLAILKLMAAEQNNQFTREVLRARVSLLDPSWVRDLIPDMPGTQSNALPAYHDLFPDVPRALQQQETPEPLSPFRAAGLEAGSNAWAASPDRSAAGGSLLANDPQTGLSAPTLWYLARLQLSTGGVIGGTIPGIPLIITGRNEQLAWGVSAAYVDDMDLHVEQVNPADRETYRTTEGWTPFTTKRTILKIKDDQPVTLTLRATKNGPILPGTHFDLGTVTPRGSVISVSWTALDPQDTSMSAAMQLMRATDVATAIDAGQNYITPAQNLVVADQKQVGRVLIGAIPKRDPKNQTEGRMPSAGWLAENQWSGRLPYADNPREIGPTDGVVMNTNNKVTDAQFPLNVTFDWGDSQRIQRLTKLLSEREVHSRESFISAQLDTVSPAARNLLPLVGADLWYTGSPAEDGTPERLRQRALELLAAWDGEMSEHLPEPLIYTAWMRELQSRLIRDELGPLASKFVPLEPLFIERVFRNRQGASHWCNIIQSGTTETCADIAKVSLDSALLDLKEHYGSNIESWRWGDAHEAHQDHPVLKNMPLIGWFANIRQSSSGGDFTLMRGETSGVGPAPFSNVQAAGYRGVYDLADPDSSVFITATGQSGHPFSRHYDDLSQLWRRGEYIPMSLDPALARAAAAGVTKLIPTNQ